jgi:hypothetical protein
VLHPTLQKSKSMCEQWLLQTATWQRNRCVASHTAKEYEHVRAVAVANSDMWKNYNQVILPIPSFMCFTYIGLARTVYILRMSRYVWYQLVHDILSQQNNRLFIFLSEPMDLFVAGRDQSAADQPNNMAEGHPPL